MEKSRNNNISKTQRIECLLDWLRWRAYNKLKSINYVKH